MRLWLFLFLCVLSLAHAAEVSRIEPKEALVNGLGLGMPIERVVSVLGAPKEKVSGKSTYPYDIEFRYEGVSFFGLNGKIDFIHISGPGVRLPSGMGIGSAMPTASGVESRIIGETDCHLETRWNEFRVNQLKIFCAL